MSKVNIVGECTDCGDEVNINKLKKYTQTVYPSKTKVIYRCFDCDRKDKENVAYSEG
jgi:DNA-directed RNA polymerase subunit RPC12/RpoP